MNTCEGPVLCQASCQAWGLQKRTPRLWALYQRGFHHTANQQQCEEGQQTFPNKAAFSLTLTDVITPGLNFGILYLLPTAHYLHGSQCHPFKTKNKAKILITTVPCSEPPTSFQSHLEENLKAYSLQAQSELVPRGHSQLILHSCPLDQPLSVNLVWPHSSSPNPESMLLFRASGHALPHRLVCHSPRQPHSSLPPFIHSSTDITPSGVLPGDLT